MKIEAFNKQYQICEYILSCGDGEYDLQWKYRKGTHFFVIAHDAREELELGRLAEELEQAGLADSAIVSIKGSRLYDAADGKISVFLFREEYVKRERFCRIQKNDINQKVPYGISVFIGEYAEEEKVMHLYPAENTKENTKYEPVRVFWKATYKSRPWWKNSLCFLELPRLDCYRDGDLEYFVEGSNVPYPLPETYMGKRLCIMIPQGTKVGVEASEKCKDYYSVRG